MVITRTWVRILLLPETKNGHWEAPLQKVAQWSNSISMEDRRCKAELDLWEQKRKKYLYLLLTCVRVRNFTFQLIAFFIIVIFITPTHYFCMSWWGYSGQIVNNYSKYLIHTMSFCIGFLRPINSLVIHNCFIFINFFWHSDIAKVFPHALTRCGIQTL